MPLGTDKNNATPLWFQPTTSVRDVHYLLEVFSIVIVVYMLSSMLLNWLTNLARDAS